MFKWNDNELCNEKERFPKIKKNCHFFGSFPKSHTCHEDLGEGEDDWSGDWFYFSDVEHWDGGGRVQEHHPSLQYIMSMKEIHESSYQEENVKDWETFENVWEAGLQIHGFTVEHKHTKNIS